MVNFCVYAYTNRLCERGFNTPKINHFMQWIQYNYMQWVVVTSNIHTSAIQLIQCYLASLLFITESAYTVSNKLVNSQHIINIL